MMEFEGEFTVDGTPDELWKYFTDPDILQDCAPGCKELRLESPSHITAALAVGVGSIKPSFDVEGIVTECDRPHSLEIRASGEASRNSFEVTARQELSDNGDGTTSVAWRADAQVSGIIASMGERALGSVADKLVTDFFESLETHVNEGTPARSRFEAASSEELAAAGYETGEPAAVAQADSGAGGGLADAGVATVADATSGEGSPGRYVAAGVVLGALGTTLWNRLRSRGAEPAAGSGGSLLVTFLGSALGAAAGVLWSQSRSADESTGPSVSANDAAVSTAPTDAASDAATAAGAATDEAPTAPSGTANRQANGRNAAADDPSQTESDNPLDRLESR